MIMIVARAMTMMTMLTDAYLTLIKFILNGKPNIAVRYQDVPYGLEEFS